MSEQQGIGKAPGLAQRVLQEKTGLVTNLIQEANDLETRLSTTRQRIEAEQLYINLAEALEITEQELMEARAEITESNQAKLAAEEASRKNEGIITTLRTELTGLQQQLANPPAELKPESTPTEVTGETDESVLDLAPLQAEVSAEEATAVTVETAAEQSAEEEGVGNGVGADVTELFAEPGEKMAVAEMS